MRIVWGVALICLLALPTATAHATQTSEDGTWFITVGHRNEPTSTWQRSGLDLIVRAVGPADDNGNPTRVEHDEALTVHQTMVATIIAPDGDEMDCPLEQQSGQANEHGVTNRYTCTDPYILSQPGQYQARLQGDIAGSAVDGLYNISGPLDNLYAEVFPPAPQLDPAAMQARIDALEARIAQLEGDDGPAASNGIPGFAPVILGLALLALAARRR